MGFSRRMQVFSIKLIFIVCMCLHAEEVAPGGGAGLFGAIPSRASRYVRPMGFNFGHATFHQRSEQPIKLYGPRKAFYVKIDQPHKDDSRVKLNRGVSKTSSTQRDGSGLRLKRFFSEPRRND